MKLHGIRISTYSYLYDIDTEPFFQYDQHHRFYAWLDTKKCEYTGSIYDYRICDGYILIEEKVPYRVVTRLITDLQVYQDLKQAELLYSTYIFEREVFGVTGNVG